MRRDRRNPRNHAFAEIALDMEFLGVAVAAVSHHRGLARLESGLGAKKFRGIGCRPALDAVVVLPSRLEGHEFGGFELHPTSRQRMLDGLVLPDRMAEHDT